MKLSEDEIEFLINEWTPEPLVPDINGLELLNLQSNCEITKQYGIGVILNNKMAINMASFNFMGIHNHDKMIKAAENAVKKYGVGTCGPPGFYGTLDIHLDCETKIAEFIGVEAAILYSQGFSAISSIIPAFCKYKDIIVCDSAVHFAIQKGVQISKSIVYYFDHNDMDHLDVILNDISYKHKDLHLTRRFIIVEGLYLNNGNICNLKRIVELKKKYKYRIIIDETMAIGTLGRSGRGSCEYHDISVEKFDLIMGSLSTAIGAGGGFCAGSKLAIDHQRLCSQSYCFSASMPALLTASAIMGIYLISNNGANLMVILKRNINLLNQLLRKENSEYVKYSSHKDSPIIHLQLKKKPGKEKLIESQYLQEIVDLCSNQNILLTRSKYVETQEHFSQTPSIRICVSANLSESIIEIIASNINRAISIIMKNY